MIPDLDRIERDALALAVFADGYEEATALIVATLRGEGLAFDVPRAARRMRSVARDTLDLVAEARLYRAARKEAP